jgi:hypothetical protein
MLGALKGWGVFLAAYEDEGDVIVGAAANLSEVKTE